MEKIKPCPFCGGEAELYRYSGSEDDVWLHFIECKSCGSNNEGWREGAKIYYSEEETTEAWNTRYERTCRINETKDDEFGIYDYLSCGYIAMRQCAELPNYCPNCGAKVVNNDN